MKPQTRSRIDESRARLGLRPRAQVAKTTQASDKTASSNDDHQIAKAVIAIVPSVLSVILEHVTRSSKSNP